MTGQRKRIYLLGLFIAIGIMLQAQKPEMYFSDTGVFGKPFAKDPKVISFHGKYLMYYSIPGAGMQNWFIGIAASDDLTDWKKIGEIKPEADYEKNGLCAPGALVIGDKVHLFYQTYGNGPKDAICHATSDDGVHFSRDSTNPVFRPAGSWTVGRAIDAEVVRFKDRYFLYFATRDSSYRIQKQGVAVTALTSTFSRGEWTQAVDSSILKPELPWEKACIEAASCIQHGKDLYMFYAGGYNNEPQQIGVARSRDGIHWTRVFTTPFLPNGSSGSWNESESGHPDIFQDQSGKTWLFFQGNNDKGRSWYLSKKEVKWKGGKPYLVDTKR